MNKKFSLHLRNLVLAGIAVAFYGAATVIAVDSGVILIPTVVYASAVIILGIAAIAAHRSYPNSATSKFTIAVFIISALLSIVVYTLARIHAERHRTGPEAEGVGTETNSMPMSDATLKKGDKGNQRGAKKGEVKNGKKSKEN